MKHFEELPTAERERKLWEASQQYLSGNMEVDDFEKIEYPFLQRFKKGALTPAKTWSIENLSSLGVIILLLALIILGFITFLLTKEQFTLLLPSIFCYPLIKIANLYFKKDGT